MTVAVDGTRRPAANSAPRVFQTQCGGHGPPCEMNELWSGGCQSRVKMTGISDAAQESTNLFKGSINVEVSCACSTPPSQKSCCTSITRSAAFTGLLRYA